MGEKAKFSFGDFLVQWSMEGKSPEQKGIKSTGEESGNEGFGREEERGR